jgi:hypothetical protein
MFKLPACPVVVGLCAWLLAGMFRGRPAQGGGVEQYKPKKDTFRNMLKGRKGDRFIFHKILDSDCRWNDMKAPRPVTAANRKKQKNKRKQSRKKSRR